MRPAAFMDAQPKSRASVEPDKSKADLLGELLDVSGALLRGQALRHAPRPADAEDALQDACVQFLRRYNGPVERDPALRWMLLVTKRCAWQLGRRADRESPSSESGVLDAAESGAGALSTLRRGPAERAELDAELGERWELLRALKRDEQRAIVELALGYSYREICERHGWTHTKLNRCLSEGRAALRRMKRGER